MLNYKIEIRRLTSADALTAKSIIQEANWNQLPTTLTNNLHGSLYYIITLSVVAAAIYSLKYYMCFMNGKCDNYSLFSITFLIPLLVISGLCMSVLVCLLSLIATLFYMYGPPLSDMAHVEVEYLTNPCSVFFVAFAVPSTDSIKELLIGTVAIVPKPLSGHADGVRTAWLRRMAVSIPWRGRGVARQLVQAAVQFCKDHNYIHIELITTEVHKAARKLYESEGFLCKAYKPYSYYGGLVRIWTYEYTLNIICKS